MRLIVAGSRTITDSDWVHRELDRMTAHVEVEAVISGHASGVDLLGESWATANDLPIEVYLPDWDKEGRAAGYRRNERMADVADSLAAFWDGESRGTKHMIDIARKAGLNVRVVRR